MFLIVDHVVLVVAVAIVVPVVDAAAAEFDVAISGDVVAVVFHLVVVLVLFAVAAGASDFEYQEFLGT